MLTRVLAGVGVVAIVLGAGWLLINGVGPRTPEAPALVEQIREVARLETLEVRLYKRVSFAPEPAPAATVWGDVLNWVKQSLAGKSGRAIVFADVSLGLSLDKLTAENVHVRGSRVEVALPPLHEQVALRPEETEIIDSNLDSAQTAKLFELAKDAFEREVEGDAALQKKARASAERAVRGVLMSVGFREVVFVPWPTY